MIYDGTSNVSRTRLFVWKMFFLRQLTSILALSYSAGKKRLIAMHSSRFVTVNRAGNCFNYSGKNQFFLRRESVSFFLEISKKQTLNSLFFISRNTC